MDRPVALLVDSCAETRQSLLQLLNATSLSAEDKTRMQVDLGVPIYKATLDTKYYTADVYLCVVDSPTCPQEATQLSTTGLGLCCSLASSIEAVIVSGESSARASLSVVKQLSPELRILLLKRHPDITSAQYDEAVTATDAWATEHGFEVAEMNPSKETIEELDDCRETYGLQRVVQALRSLPWSNAAMKSEPNSGNFERLRRILDEDDATDTACTPQPTAAGADVACDSSALVGDSAAVNGSPSTDDDDFEALFAQLALMKERAGTLPENSEERRAYAEQVTMAFWQAVGGDQDEISDIIGNK